MKGYSISGTVSRVDEKGWETVRQVPTFILYSNIQGIVSEGHAEHVGRWVVNPLGDKSLKVNLWAIEIDID